MKKVFCCFGIGLFIALTLSLFGCSSSKTSSTIPMITLSVNLLEKDPALSYMALLNKYGSVSFVLKNTEDESIRITKNVAVVDSIYVKTNMLIPTWNYTVVKFFYDRNGEILFSDPCEGSILGSELFFSIPSGC